MTNAVTAVKHGYAYIEMQDPGEFFAERVSVVCHDNSCEAFHALAAAKWRFGGNCWSR
jgi:hypothetical protein